MRGRKRCFALTLLLSFALYGATVASGAAPEAKETVKLNFDSMPLQEWINQVARMLGINYVLTPKLVLTDPVTMHTAEPIYKEDLFAIFDKVLQEHGAAVVKDTGLKNFYYIVPLAEASKKPLPLYASYGQPSVGPLAGIELKNTAKLNFDNLPLGAFVNQMAGMLRINYSIDPKLAQAGRVTLHTTEPVNKEDLFRVFETVLYMNNATVVQDPKLDRLYHISPRAEDEREITKDGKKYIRTPFGDTPKN